jgi:hypothetical protein
MNRGSEQPLQTFELNIRLRTYDHCISPGELPNLITAALDGDGHSCLLHASAWTPMVRGEKYLKDDRPTCGICLENIEKNKLVVKTPCNHLFHKTCLQTWFRKNQMLFAATCPNCRARVPVEYKFNRAAEVLSKPKIDNRGEVYYERMLVPQSGKHYNKLIYATRV